MAGVEMPLKLELVDSSTDAEFPCNEHQQNGDIDHGNDSVLPPYQLVQTVTLDVGSPLRL